LGGSSIGLLSRPTIRKGVITLADQAVVSVTNFLTGVIVGRACTKEELGLYMLGFTIVLFFIGLQSSIISIPYTVYGPRLEPKDLFEYTGSTLTHQFALSTIATICLISAGLTLSLGIGPEGLSQVTWALAVTIIFILLREYARQLFFAHLRMQTAFLMDLCLFGFQIGGLIAFAYLDLLSASKAYLVIGVESGLVTFYWLILFRKTFLFKRLRVLVDLGRNWSFGKWHVLSTLSNFVGNQAFPWFLAAFHGTTATGVLAACLGISALANPLLMGVINFLRPHAAHALNHGGTDQMLPIIFKSTIVIAMFMCLFGAIVFLLGEQLVVLIYGAKYAGTGLIMAILIIGMCVNALLIPINCALHALNRPDVGFKSRFIAMGVTLTLGLWLVSSFGATGVAIGLLAANFVASVYEAIAFMIIIRRNRISL